MRRRVLLDLPVDARDEVVERRLGRPGDPELRAQKSLASFATAADVPYLSGRVVDNAEILGASTRDALTSKLKSYEERTGHHVTLAARERGAIIRPLGDVVVLMPPLSISDDELGRLVAITGESIAAVTSSQVRTPAAA